MLHNFNIEQQQVSVHFRNILFLMKTGLVRPIHKSWDNAVFNNYRPISVLPAMSKILEKVLNNHLVNYLELKHLLSCKQIDFRRGKSTREAVSALIGDAVNHLDKKEKCSCIFLDITKAFDVVLIPLLLSKLETMDIRGTQLDIFKNIYLNAFRL